MNKKFIVAVTSMVLAVVHIGKSAKKKTERDLAYKAALLDFAAGKTHK